MTAIFRESGATPKTATETGALPLKVPTVRPMAGWQGEQSLPAAVCERVRSGSPLRRARSHAPYLFVFAYLVSFAVHFFSGVFPVGALVFAKSIEAELMQ
jgi:hypothetical protein